MVSETGDAKLFNSYADVTDMEVGLSVDSDNVSTHIGLGLKNGFTEGGNVSLSGTELSWQYNEKILVSDWSFSTKVGGDVQTVTIEINKLAFATMILLGKSFNGFGYQPIPAFG